MKSSSWAILLLAGLAAASATLPPQKPPLTSDKMVELAVGLDNQKSGENSTFGLLEASPQPSWPQQERAKRSLKKWVKKAKKEARKFFKNKNVVIAGGMPSGKRN